MLFVIDLNFYFVKEMDMIFHAQFETRTCFETARAVSAPLKYMFSLYLFSLNLDQDSKLAL